MSRRKAEELIRLGINITVNGQAPCIGQMVDENDDVRIGDEKVLLPQEHVYIKLNKPKGYTCTNRSFKGEQNIFELVKTEYQLHVVGRLDKDSRGLVVLTNDGEFTQKMTHPKFQHEKEYIVEVRNNLRKNPLLTLIKKLEQGVDIGDGDGVVTVKSIKHLSEKGENHKFNIILTQGKKRQIRRMFGALGWDVVDILRTRIEAINLNSLKEGEWEFTKSSH